MAFELKSFQQILASMIAEILANTPLTAMNKGAIISSVLEAAATEDFNQYFQMLAIISNFALDNTAGEDLDNRAVEFGLDGRNQPTRAFTTVTISDTSFDKIATKLYAGLSGPTKNSTTILVDDTTGFPASGSIIIGRNVQANVEVISYTSITPGITFDTINLASGLANDHGTDETVILSQGGDRVIGAGTVVKVPASDFNEDILFSTNFEAIIFDGEVEITGVEITAIDAGTDSNVPTNSINVFDTLPFPGATVSNTSAVTNGTDLETDQELRDRIKDTIQALSRGTSTSIITSVVGIVDPDDNKRVVSANLIDVTDVADIASLIIDDGTGFEPSFEGQGFETVIQDATGGEEFIQIDLFPIVKATITTLNSEPYNISNNQTLIYKINNVEETVTFVDDDFRINNAAQAQEIVTAINNRATLIEARTTGGGKRVEIQAKVNVNEGVEIVGGTANATNLLNFPVGFFETLKLYKFDGNRLIVLDKDGSTAVLESGNQQPFNMVATPTYLDIQVDGETHYSGDVETGGLNNITDSALITKFTDDDDLNNQTVTFVDGINVGLTAPIVSYVSATGVITLSGGLTAGVGDIYQIDDLERIHFSNSASEDFLNPAAATVVEIIAVINRKLKGVGSATSSGNKVLLTSKIDNSAASKIKVHGGTANAILGFSTTESVGTNRY